SRVIRARVSSRLGMEKNARSRSVRTDQIHTSREGLRKGSARRSTPSMPVAITALAAMHRPSVRTNPAENAGARAIRRRAELPGSPRRDIETSDPATHSGSKARRGPRQPPEATPVPSAGRLDPGIDDPVRDEPGAGARAGATDPSGRGEARFLG